MYVIEIIKVLKMNKLPDPDWFWCRVVRGAADQCWSWEGPRTATGHGTVALGRSTTSAHRLAYMLAVGPIPTGLVVRHKCDHGWCCNPAHLELGTQAQNLRDMVERNRADWQRGHKRKFGPRINKLHDAEIRGVRAMSRSDLKRNQVAEHYGISEQHVSAIVNRRRKGHVSDDGPVSYRRPDDRQTTDEVLRLHPLVAG